MQSLSRQAVGTVARLLVVLLALGTAVPSAAHGDAEHDPCDAVLGADGAYGRFYAPVAPVRPRHCTVCHWLRSLRVFDAVVIAPSSGAHVTCEALALRPDPGAWLSTPSIPARAPPA